MHPPFIVRLLISIIGCTTLSLLWKNNGTIITGGSKIKKSRKFEDKTVCVFYLVPSNKKERSDYKIAMENNIRHVQAWYQQQMGRTFRLHAPVVKVLYTSHEDNWYKDNPNSSNLFHQFWTNVINDAEATDPSAKSNRDRLNVYYIDADGACGQCAGCGADRTVVIGANDLRGMVGESWVPICPGENFSFKPCRFSGGLAHELGHGFGLPHPEEKDTGSLVMGSGFYNYPNCSLSLSDAKRLINSDWAWSFFYTGITTEKFDCNDLVKGPGK